jgi:hypothetical protein
MSVFPKLKRNEAHLKMNTIILNITSRGLYIRDIMRPEKLGIHMTVMPIKTNAH